MEKSISIISCNFLVFMNLKCMFCRLSFMYCREQSVECLPGSWICIKYIETKCRLKLSITEIKKIAPAPPHCGKCSRATPLYRNNTIRNVIRDYIYPV
jgi:hypothetical protein